MIRLHPVEGHREVLDLLVRAHGARGLPHALLLHGPRGVGKQRVALWLAQLQMCSSPGPEGPCGACRDCRLALGLEHPDLHWYFPVARPKGVSGDRLADALEGTRIEALADLRATPIQPSQGDESRGIYLGLVQGLRRRAQASPTMASVQVFVIGEAEYLVPQESSHEAANALLKLLEEPPPATRFVLTSSEPGRLLPTIRSRTVPLHLPPLPPADVAAFLERHMGVDGDTAARAAALAQGSIGRALGFLPDGDGPGPLEARRQEALRILEAALDDGAAQGFVLALHQTGRDARRLVDLFAFLEEWLRDLAAVAAGAEEQVLSADALPRLRSLAAARAFPPSAAADSLRVLEEARELARGNVNPQLIFAELARRLRKTLRPASVWSS